MIRATCHICKQQVAIHARGLCRACYMDLSRKGEHVLYKTTDKQKAEADRYAEKAKITCLNCNTGHIISRGLCRTCYREMEAEDRLDEFLPHRYKNVGEMKLLVCLEKFDRESAWEVPAFSEEAERV